MEKLFDYLMSILLTSLFMTPYIVVIGLAVYKWGETQKANEEKFKEMYKMIQDEFASWPNSETPNATIRQHIEELKGMRHKNREMVQVLETEFKRRIERFEFKRKLQKIVS